MAVKPIVKTFEYFLDRLLRGFKKDQGREPNNLEMILIKQEAGNKAKDANKVIEVQFGRPFGEEVNKLIESGDVKIGEVTKKNDNVLQREMFQNSNLNKPTIEGQMEKITNASNRIDEIMKEQADMYRPKTDEEIAAKFERQNKEAAERLRKKMKDEPEDKADGGRIGFESGKVVLAKKIYNLLKNNKKIKEAVDNIFGTGDYKMDAEMAAESLVELNPKEFNNMLYEDLPDNVRSEIYGAVLQPITTNMAKMRELKKASKPTKTLESIKETGTIDISDPNVADEFARFMKETDPEGSKKLEQTVELANFDPKGRKKNATGGRARLQEGGLPSVDPRMNLDYDTLVEQNVDKRLQDPNFLNNIQEVKGTEETLGPITKMPVETNPDIPVEKINSPYYTGKNYGPGDQPYTAVMPQEGMRYVYDEQGTRYSVPKTQPTTLEDYLSGYEQYKSNNPNKYAGTQALVPAMLPGGFQYTFSSGPHANHFNDYLESLGLSPYEKYIDESMIEKFNQGGRAGFYTGGITDVEPSLDDIGHGSDSLMSRTRLMSPGSQATTSTGLNYLLAEDNDNLRIPFSKGKLAKEIVDKGRRGFMKAAGAAGAGIAALKTGLLGLGEKAAPVVEKVAETVSDTAGQVPPYFFRLVEKIRFMGDDTLASQDKAIAKKYKDYVMEEDFAGNITIVKSGEDLQGNKLEDVYMNYKVDDVALKDKDGFAKAEDYEEFTARPDAEGKMKDVEPGVPDEVIEEAGDIDAMTLKKAEGGRIGFSKGKLVFENAKKFLEKIFGKENMAEMPNRDPEMYQGMLEVVDMFRKRDKEGLKKYMQKFLPHMDDAQVEDFIVGDAEDMAGLGKFGLGNLQGQLIRLGSGRDYQSKIEAFKRLERNKELKDLEVTEDMQRKPNASGGLAKMLGE